MAVGRPTVSDNLATSSAIENSWFQLCCRASLSSVRWMTPFVLYFLKYSVSDATFRQKIGPHSENIPWVNRRVQVQVAQCPSCRRYWQHMQEDSHWKCHGIWEELLNQVLQQLQHLVHLQLASNIKMCFSVSNMVSDVIGSINCRQGILGIVATAKDKDSISPSLLPARNQSIDRVFDQMFTVEKPDTVS